MPTLNKVSLDIQVVLGTTTMPVHQVLRLGRGAIIELESSEDDEVQIFANNFPVAKGTVIVSGNRIAVEVKDLLPRPPLDYFRRFYAGYVTSREHGCSSCPCSTSTCRRTESHRGRGRIRASAVGHRQRAYHPPQHGCSGRAGSAAS